MKTSKTPIIITSIIAITLILLALIFLNALSPSPQGKTITTQGQSSLEATPELTSIHFNIQTSGDTNKEAKDKNSEILEQVKSSLISQGFQESEIQTTGFNIYQDRDWETGKIKTYRATHSLIVKSPFQESDKIGKALDAGIDGGASVSYINFELTQETQSTLKAQALEAAAKDARTKAQALARGLDKNLGSLVSASDSFTYSPWLAYEARGDASVSASSEEIQQATTSINPNDRKISASVTAVYKIN